MSSSVKVKQEVVISRLVRLERLSLVSFLVESATISRERVRSRAGLCRLQASFSSVVTCTLLVIGRAWRPLSVISKTSSSRLFASWPFKKISGSAELIFVLSVKLDRPINSSFISTKRRTSSEIQDTFRQLLRTLVVEKVSSQLRDADCRMCNPQSLNY
jgi:hypothetical protein